jgi:Cu+-exporting ATPase
MQMSIHIENMLCNFWDCLSEAMYPEQVGNRKLITESGISIPTNVERFLVELEESAKTGILVAYDDNLLGVLGVADPLKREAAVVVEGLGKMGVTTVMVTGDNWRTARAVAKEVSIEFLFVSNLNPRF